jgi:hypothetical protein
MDAPLIVEGLRLLTGVVPILKKLVDGLPKNENKVEATETLERVERQLKIAEAQIMQGFGYELCRNHNPPEIMLSKDDKNWICPSCGNRKDTCPPKPRNFVLRSPR